MYHSIIISGKNTYDEWGLIPTSRPLVNPPEVKTTYVDIPSSHGILDYTELLLWEPPFRRREGSWEFAVKPGDSWASVYSSLLNYVHGKEHYVILEDDPDYKYQGRLTLNSWKSDPEYSVITIDYSLDPFKYSVRSSEDEDWLWDDLFDLTIRYGTFTVSGTKYRTFINEGSKAVTPFFTCSAGMTVAFNGVTYTLVAGRNYNANLSLQPGDNLMLFTGTGTVLVSYSEVSL